MIHRIERLARRRSRSEAIISPELARSLCELARELNRQLGFLIGRHGHVCEMLIGDARSIFLPDLSSYREGRDRLCGLRLIHTHLYDEVLDDDDLTDLALLRLDLVAAITVEPEGLPGVVHVAHLLPANDAELPWEILAPVPVHDLPEDFSSMIAALEQEFARSRKARVAGDNRARSINVHVSQETPTDAAESIAELRQLSASAGISVAHEIIQRRPVDQKYVMGKGKLKQAVIKAMQVGAEIIIFDLNLTPTQVKVVADMTDLKVLDRTQVILDIFAQHAQTREGRIQVELAQLRYLLPRLSTKHTAMSRLTGGIGGRGPGETKLEVDRRRAKDRITKLQSEIKKLGKRRKLRRTRRTEKDLPTIAIVGYTNAGKSTLLNKLTRSNVTAQDTVFATLDPVSRRLRFPKEREVIITDTVGFIRNLPKELMDAFRTTFEEIAPADLLLVVMDASSSEIEEHHATVRSVLAELGLDNKPVLNVLNKSDLCESDILTGLVRRFNGVAVSALNRDTFTPLLDAIMDRLWTTEPDGSPTWVPTEALTETDGVKQDVV